METTDQSKLMFSIGLTDSLDSSSDDIIPMQSRRKKRAITRKNRNARLAHSSSFLKTNYSYGLCTLIKFIFVILTLISVIIGMVVMYSLSKRMDSLHLSMSGLQTTNKDLPDDLHSLHSKYKALEQESTNLKINLNNVIITTSNLTQQTAQLHQKLNQLNEALTFSLNINKQLPNDVEELKKLVTSLKEEIDSHNDSKLSKEQETNLELRLNAFESKLQQNITLMYNTSWNHQIEQMIFVIKNQITMLNSSLTNINSIISAMNQPKMSIQKSIKTDSEPVQNISGYPTGTSRIKKKELPAVENIQDNNNT